MSRLFKHKIAILLFSLFTMFIIEASMLLIIFHSFFPVHYILELSFMLYLLVPGILFKSNKATAIYCSVFVLAFAVLFAVNTNLSFASDDIFTFKYLMLTKEAVAVFSGDFINWWYILIIFTILGIYITGIALSFKKYTYEKEGSSNLKFRLSLYMLLSILCIFSRSLSYSNIESEQARQPLYKDKSGIKIIEFTTKNLKRSSMRNYGLISYVIADVTNIMPIQNEKDLDEVSSYLSSGNIIKNDKKINSKLCKIMNVLKIMIETGCSFAINEYLTPNLYSLMNEGIYFNNCLSKNKTNVSEFIGVAGSATTSAVLQNLTDTKIPFALPNVINDYYKTSYFHCNYASFYSRYNSIEALGFENYYFVDKTKENGIVRENDKIDGSYPLEWFNIYGGNYPLDTEFFELIGDKMIPEKSSTPFYSFWTTLATHGPYNYSLADVNREKFHNLGYYNKIEEAKALGYWENICSDDDEIVQGQIEWFQCAMMNFDDALGMVLQRLSETGQLDNTLIVLYGDHENYYMIDIDEPLKNYIYNLDDAYVPYQYETAMIMYNPKLVSRYKDVYHISDDSTAIYEQFVSPFIIVPTILDLLGIDYRENWYVGTSAFRTKSVLDNIHYSYELNIAFADKLVLEELYEYKYDNADSEIYKELFNEKVIDLLYKINLFNFMYENAYYGN